MQSFNDNEAIRLENVTKRFGGVTALDDVSFSIRQGEIHAIVGENGAGKSTMMKLLAGINQPDEGKIFVGGEETKIPSPREAEALGIAMVFQELNLFETLSVAANIFVNKEPRTGAGFLDEKTMYAEAKEVLESLMVDIDPATKVGMLSTGLKQIVEIARAIQRGTNVVIMDEPNSALNDQETKALFKIIDNLKSKGITIIYVSHRLEEVFTIADRISVLRDGHYIGTWDKDKTTVDQIVTNVVGRQLGEVYPPRVPIKSGSEVILSVRGLQIDENTEPITFEAHKGEVLGFAGLQGSGVQEMLSQLFGLERETGPFEVIYDGEPLKSLTPIKLIGMGWAFIPANRRDEGLMLDWSILKNVSIVIIDKLLNQLGFIHHARETDLSTEYIDRFGIATDSLGKKVHYLSGGNQQKVVLAKWLATNPNLLILNDPTRGIDVGTKREIFKYIADWSRQGCTILFTSSEIEEVLGMSHRVLVMYKGSLIREFDGERTNKEEVMRYVLGGDLADEKAGELAATTAQ
jgi:ribose transport system ATP-binding protein